MATSAWCLDLNWTWLAHFWSGFIYASFQPALSSWHFLCIAVLVMLFHLFVLPLRTFFFFFFFQPKQASRCVGEDSRLPVCHCRRADDRSPGPCHCFQLQLLLPQRDWPRGNAVAEFQPCPELSVHAGAFRWAASEQLICHPLGSWAGSR